MPGGKIDILVEPDLRGFDGKLGRGLRGAAGLASTIGKGIGLAIAGGTALAAVGLKEVIKVGVEYQGNLNSLQAVTGATAMEMARIGATAKALGADMSLPATSAADAAAAMLELSKGGLSVEQAMSAAKGTLQLAAAAQIDAAQAAEIQSAALNQFGLEASQAGRVADILANTANAAAGEITDMALALKYVGPVAKSMSISIEDTAAAVGLLANNGIRGENAGTALRGILASLAAPSKEAAGALKTLGIQAFDQQGKFVGLRKVTDDLSKAKGRMTEAEFTAAAANAFGREPLAAITALAQEGAPAFDEMAKAVARQGGAADVAAAKTKGLGGAWEGLKSQLETVSIGIFEAIDGPLEAATRAVANWFERNGDTIVKGIENMVAAGESFGPLLAQAIQSRLEVIGTTLRDVLGPLVRPALQTINQVINVAIDLWDDLTQVFKNVVDAARPVARGIADVASAANSGHGVVTILAGALRLAGDVIVALSAALVPIGKLVGAMASAFAELPGPIQTAAIAMGLLIAFRGPLSTLGSTISDRVTGPFKALGQEVKLQQALLTGSTQIMSQSVSSLGLAMAALETRVPALGRMADAYRTASEATRTFVTNQSSVIQASSGISGTMTGVATAVGKAEGAIRTLGGVAAGTAAALGSGLKSAALGLLGALGGPWGLVITGAAIGLSLWADANAKAAERARAHANAVSSLADQLRESNGVITESIRSARAKELADAGALNNARTLSIALDDVTSATFRQGTAYEDLKSRLEDIIAANTRYEMIKGTEKNPQYRAALTENGQAARNLLNTINDLSGKTDQAQQRQRDLEAAIRSGKASMLDTTESGRNLSSAMQVLADKTSSADDRARALKSALDALSGNAISYDQSVARFQESIDRLGKGFGEAVGQAKEFGKSLINADGSINSSLPKGRELLNIVTDLTTNMADSAQKAFDMAGGINNIGPATDAAKGKIQEGRQAILDAAKAAGFNEQETLRMIDRYKLVPELVATLITQPGMDKALLELLLLKGSVNAVPGQKTITTTVPLSEEAQRKLEAVGIRVERIKDSKEIRLTALDGDFNSAVARATAPASKQIVFRYQGMRAEFATGGIVARAYADGGVERKLTPMRGGYATIVPPNTWRVVGDRVRDDEAYIPINDSLRSQKLLQTTAYRMGYALIRRFAEGGFTSSREPALVGAQSVSGPSITNNVVVQRNEDASTVARVLSAEQSWQLRRGRP